MKVDSVYKAFECEECGSIMSVPNSNMIALYCSEYDCSYEVSWNHMSVEQKYYAKIAQEQDSPICSSERVVQTLKDIDWNSDGVYLKTKDD